MLAFGLNRARRETDFSGFSECDAATNLWAAPEFGCGLRNAAVKVKHRVDKFTD